MNKEDLKAIEQQLTYALDELQNEEPDINLLHDWISDPLRRVKKLIIPDVVVSETECKHEPTCGHFPCNLSECPEFEEKVSEAEVCRCKVDSCMHHKGNLCMAAAWKCVDRQT